MSELTTEMLSRLEYVGGGYFRAQAPKGKNSPTFHGPELLRFAQELATEVERLKRFDPAEQCKRQGHVFPRPGWPTNAACWRCGVHG